MVTLKGIKVFLGSPTDLSLERERFLYTINSFNQTEVAEGYIFVPIMNEFMTGGYGRAQGRINQELLKKLDYGICMFWKTLGSRAGNTDEKTGTEEEYEQLVELKKKGELREVVLFFKKIENNIRIDPGDELKKLLEFKENHRGECSYIEFDESNFNTKIYQHLHDWICKIKTQKVPVQKDISAANYVIPEEQIISDTEESR